MALRLASPFQDHAVLQRDQPLPVWGWAPPHARLRISLAGRVACGASDADGDFHVRLPALPAGGPHTLRVETWSGDHVLELTDILIGEVWFASGQSNMAWLLSQTLPLGEEIIATADFPQIRFLNVKRRAHLGAHRTVEARWLIASPATAPHLSAVAFTFARALHRALGVPVGILSAAWGGTPIEAWISRGTLAANPDMADALAALDEIGWSEQRWQEAGDLPADGRVSNFPRDPGVTQPWHAANLDDSAWETVALPSTWQNAGHAHQGVFWFRRTIEIPAAWIGRDLELHLGAIDKQDITFVNGEEIARTGRDREEQFCNVPRTYAVPARLIASTRLRLAVRVYSFVYDGGFHGPAAEMCVRPAGTEEPGLSLAGEWRLCREHDFGRVVEVVIPGHGEPRTPHVLFDNQVAPLAPYALRGVIWYQGETNADRHATYARLLQDLIADWRQAWARADLAFHLVQLPRYKVPADYQSDSTWAPLREAQQAAATALPHVGLATTLDLGEADDIHPKDKAPVGERLARSALVLTYGRTGVPGGPVPLAATAEGDAMRIIFSYTSGGLATRDGAAPRPFALAGADRVFHPATAELDGAAVVVRSPAVPRPVAVRYAWADNPETANLVNGEGLPAGSFRSDRW